MKADPDAQLRLLDLQGADSTLDRLAHRRRTLPELGEIEAATTALAAERDAVVAAETEDRDLGRDQTKLENDVEMVRTRMTRDQQRLDTGAVGSPKELENLQSEITSLHRRQAELEDQVLELMERRESVQQRLDEHRAASSRLEEQIADAERRRDAAFAEIDEAAEKARMQREELAAGLPRDLLDLYEKIRASAGGVGAAALARGRCEGCHLQLTTSDVAKVRAAPADEVLRCEECRRVLIRTPESGL